MNALNHTLIFMHTVCNSLYSTLAYYDIVQDCSELIFLDTQLYHRNKNSTNCMEGTQIVFVFGNGTKVVRT